MHLAIYRDIYMTRLIPDYVILKHPSRKANLCSAVVLQDQRKMCSVSTLAYYNHDLLSPG